MASTNKTTNLSLSQFIATDKPSWLSDYNADMAKIDAGYGTAISDSASAVSGAASASAAAQAAQTTANSAETRSTNNAVEITNIKNNLKASLVQGTLLNNTSGTFNIYTSSYLTIVKFDIIFKNVPTDTTVSGTLTRFPIASVAQNIYNLSASNIASPVSAWITSAYTFYNDSFTPLMLPMNAYYDGTNTIYYSTIPTSVFSQITSIKNYSGIGPFLPSGTFTNVELNNKI